MAVHLSPRLLSLAPTLLGLLLPNGLAAQKLETDRPLGKLEVVATFPGPMLTGVTVSRHNRIFVNFPRWGDEVPFTVAEVVNGKAVAYPNAQVNDWQNTPEQRANAPRNATHFVSVQSVVVDPADRLWVVDTGAPLLKDAVVNGPKIVCIDLATNEVVKTILLPPEVAGVHSYMNDIRFDLSVGEPATQDQRTSPASAVRATTNHLHPAGGAAIDPGGSEPIGSGTTVHGFAYLTDSSDQGPNGIVVVDLGSGRSWRRLNNHFSTLPEPGYVSFAEGRPLYQTEPGKPPRPTRFGSDGIAISADGSKLFYCPVSSSKLYSVSTAALRNEKLSDDQVASTVQLVTGKAPSDGLESDSAGNVYAGDYTSNSIDRIAPSSGMIETIVHDPRLLWPDTMSLSDDGYLYVTANQLNRQPTMHNGEDQRIRPYVLFRVKVDAKPVRLTR